MQRKRTLLFRLVFRCDRFVLLLVHAFYARQDTLTPALIGAYAIAVYLGVALVLLPHIGLLSLMVADSIKHVLHMTISALILRRRIGRLAGQSVVRTLLASILAAAVMGGLALGLLNVIRDALPGTGLLAELAAVAGPGLAGAALYALLLALLRVDEVRLLWDTLRGRLAGR